jgi:predicted nucleotidyltransferase
MKNFIETNKILEIITGSYLYGTNTDTSDKDYVGIFMPTEEYVFGFKKMEEIDLSIHHKLENGKNAPEAIDRKFYEFRKFVKLALENNPNILEILFVNDKNIESITPLGRALLDIKDRFPWRGLKEKFLGYAFSQKHKMIIKKDNYFDLIQAVDYLTKFHYRKTLLEAVLQPNNPFFLKIQRDKNNNITLVSIGDQCFNPSITIKSTLTNLQERINKAGNREELLLKYGFDTKFASHLVRLMLEGKELLITGKIEFPLKQSNLIIDIKQGKWKISDILKYSADLEKEIEELTIHSKLPTKPRIQEIEKFVIKHLKEYLE